MNNDAAQHRNVTAHYGFNILKDLYFQSPECWVLQVDCLSQHAKVVNQFRDNDDDLVEKLIKGLGCFFNFLLFFCFKNCIETF